MLNSIANALIFVFVSLLASKVFLQAVSIVLSDNQSNAIDESGET